jgi:hypothetical protein
LTKKLRRICFSEFDVPEFEDDIDIIITAIDKIVENGALEQYFRPEGGKLKAIPLNSSQLRLYCYLVNEEIMILGNGGQKTTRTVNEDPILTEHTEILRGVGNMLSSRINKGTVQVYKKQLYGNLEFQLEVKE